MRISITLFSLIIWCVAASGGFAVGQPADTPQTAPAATIDSSLTASTSAPADSATAMYPVSPERRALLNKYSTQRLIMEVVSEAFSWIVLLIVAFTGLSAWLLKIASRVTRRRAIHFVVFLFLFLLLTGIISFPLDYYQNYVVEHQYGLSNQSFGAWFGEMLKQFPIMLVFMSIPLGFLYWLIRRFPRRWWAWFTAGAIPFLIITFIIVPVVVSPLFNDFQPLKDKQLETQILSLASKAGIEGSRVFEVDASRQSNKLNAYVTGLFGTKRIVLYDTIIAAFTADQILFVMGHEMCHYVKHHIWYFVGLITLLILLSTWLTARYLPALISRHRRRLGFDSLTSYASLPLIFLSLSLVMFFAQPATNAVSRYFEYQCDAYSLKINDYNVEDATIAFEKLSAYNLSNPDPHPLVEYWFYDHPALQKRIDRMRQLAGQ